MIVFPTQVKDSQVTVHATCVFCGKESDLTVSKAAYGSWIDGQFAQFAFPNLDADTREYFFVGGICPSCYKDL